MTFFKSLPLKAGTAQPSLFQLWAQISPTLLTKKIPMQLASKTMDQSVNLTRCQAILGSRSSSQNSELSEYLGDKTGTNPEVYQFAFSKDTLNLAYDKPYDEGEGVAGNGTVAVWWVKSPCGLAIIKTGVSEEDILDWVCTLHKLIDTQKCEFKNLGVNISKFKQEFDPFSITEIFDHSRKITGFSDRIARKVGMVPDYLTIGPSYQFVFSNLNSRLVLGMSKNSPKPKVWADYHPEASTRPIHNDLNIDDQDSYQNRGRRPLRRKGPNETPFINTISNPTIFFQCLKYVGRKVKEQYLPIFQFVAHTEH